MWREILGLEKKSSGLVELIVPRRSFADVVLPEETRQQLYEALTHIEKHRLIFTQWGLGERHPTGLGLAFNFAGPPGTGKTICAEATAYTLGRKLLRVRYSELESCWAGETGKNLRAVFREARAQDAVLFFDEADSVASRRFSSVQIGYEREANQAVNILLKELEEHEGVVIFATNMASNFDPAFERRIRTHILFRIPSMAERERIWRVQIHPQKTPLATDVDFRELAERYEVAGGDIRTAVLKAAQIAAAEAGPDDEKQLCQRHFLLAMEQVLAARRVMQQNSVDSAASLPLQELIEGAERRLEALDADLQACRTELELLSGGQSDLTAALRAQEGAVAARLDDTSLRLRGLDEQLGEQRAAVERARGDWEQRAGDEAGALQVWRGAQEASLEGLLERVRQTEERLAVATLIPWRRSVTVATLVAGALAALALGGAGGFWLR